MGESCSKDSFKVMFERVKDPVVKGRHFWRTKSSLRGSLASVCGFLLSHCTHLYSQPLLHCKTKLYFQGLLINFRGTLNLLPPVFKGFQKIVFRYKSL